ncbi:MAG TPA: hypothetical protein VHC22_34185 [Pirellulales bacterium]|nr:hypothetical protein [Pirellulales bacterium]
MTPVAPPLDTLFSAAELLGAMPFGAPLFGAADDWMKFIPLVAFLIYLLNHFIGMSAKQPQRRPGAPEARPDPRVARPRPPARQDVTDEVAEFLRKAAEKRPTSKPAAEVRPAQARRVATPEVVEARVVPELPSNRWPEPVRPNVDNRELSGRGERLTHVEQTEAAFQAHMQSLDHTVGRINESAANAPPAGSPAESAQQPAEPPANELFAALVADPQNLRQAIILREIIERPVERW